MGAGSSSSTIESACASIAAHLAATVGFGSASASPRASSSSDFVCGPRRGVQRAASVVTRDAAAPARASLLSSSGTLFSLAGDSSPLLEGGAPRAPALSCSLRNASSRTRRPDGSGGPSATTGCKTTGCGFRLDPPATRSDTTPSATRPRRRIAPTSAAKASDDLSSAASSATRTDGRDRNARDSSTSASVKPTMRTSPSAGPSYGRAPQRFFSAGLKYERPSGPTSPYVRTSSAVSGAPCSAHVSSVRAVTNRPDLASVLRVAGGGTPRLTNSTRRHRTLRGVSSLPCGVDSPSRTSSSAVPLARRRVAKLCEAPLWSPFVASKASNGARTALSASRSAVSHVVDDDAWCCCCCDSSSWV
mmetsp:Transcript_17953/g.71961  ORF Transcript_17953/g.71961 Transcript_17953/m.71961 type:complete len:361 (+) Transcript_17953:1478-2560(+)